MVAVAAYFLASYLAILFVLTMLWGRESRREPRRNWRLRYGTLALIALPWLPYLLVDAQTAFYGPVIAPALQKNLAQMEGESRILSYKVLSVTPRDARVYVVQPCGAAGSDHRVGLMVQMYHDTRGWRGETQWSPDAVWSDCGNAQGNTFPPYLEGF